MLKKITIDVSVQDTDHESYKDPSGRSVIELYYKDIEEIEASIGKIVNGMVLMADAEYKKEIFERDKDNSESEA